MGKLPHVILTSDKDWDPTFKVDNETWFDAQSSPDGHNDKSSDEVGNF